MSEQKLMEKAMLLFFDRGKESVDLAKEKIRVLETYYEPLQKTILEFVEDWNDFLHPALISLSCEAAGGDQNATTEVGAAIVLLAGAADIHDDIIDQSFFKEPKKTILGKYGMDLALLAGDALLIKGTNMLHDACDKLSPSNRYSILKTIENTFFESSSAEAYEASLRGRFDISLQTFLEIVHHKVSTAEATTRIGAILGSAKEKEIEILAHYGRTIGILLALRDEFIDMFEIDELNNRIQKEILPLPIMLTLGNESRKSEMLDLIGCPITAEAIQRMLDLVTNSEEVLNLISYMKELVVEESKALRNISGSPVVLDQLLRATLEDIA